MACGVRLVVAQSAIQFQKNVPKAMVVLRVIPLHVGFGEALAKREILDDM